MTDPSRNFISATRRMTGKTLQSAAFALILITAGFAGWLTATSPEHTQNLLITLKDEEFGQNGYEKLYTIVSSPSVRAEAVKMLTGNHWDELTAEQRMEALENTTISGWHGFSLLVEARDDSRERAEQMARATGEAAIAALSSSGFTASLAGEAAGKQGNAFVAQVYLFVVALGAYVIWYAGVCLAGYLLPRFVFEQGRAKTRYTLMASIAALGITVILIDPQTRYSHALPFLTAILVLW